MFPPHHPYCLALVCLLVRASFAETMEGEQKECSAGSNPPTVGEPSGLTLGSDRSFREKAGEIVSVGVACACCCCECCTTHGSLKLPHKGFCERSHDSKTSSYHSTGLRSRQRTSNSARLINCPLETISLVISHCLFQKTSRALKQDSRILGA